MAYRLRPRHRVRHDSDPPGPGRAVQCGADRLRRRLPADEQGRGYRPDARPDRPAGAVPGAPAGWRRTAVSGLRACWRRPMSGLQRAGAAIVGAAESYLGHVADGLNVIDLMAQGIALALEDCGLGLRDVDGLFCA